MSIAPDRTGALDRQRRRDQSLEAARSRVDSLARDQRRTLEAEFQRAEQEARTILRHGVRPA